MAERATPRTETTTVTAPVDVAVAPAEGAPARDQADRPTHRLPLTQLYQLSIYWFGINAIWGGLNIIMQERIPPLAPPGEAGRYLALLDIFAVIVAVGVQPTVGSISDYTMSRWGRRKPYIVDRVRRSTSCSCRDRDVADATWRSSRSWCCCSSAPTSPRARSRAMCRTSSRRPGRLRERARRRDVDPRVRDRRHARGVAGYGQLLPRADDRARPHRAR